MASNSPAPAAPQAVRAFPENAVSKVIYPGRRSAGRAGVLVWCRGYFRPLLHRRAAGGGAACHPRRQPRPTVARIGGAMMRETPHLHTGTARRGLHADCGRCGESAWPTGGPLAPIDLLFTAAAIEEQLRLAIRDRQWLDAYLLAAGLNQMVEDRLHPDPLQLRRAAGYLRGRGSRAARFGGRMSGAAAGLLRPFAVGSRSASLWRGRESLTEATIRLAGAVLDPEGVDPVIPAGLDTLQATVRALGADVVRVPTCFRSFDQHPDDIRELVRRFVRSHPMSTPLCVVGVRTSGSYLAPLCAGALRAAGVTSVAVLTYRPGRPWRRAEAKTVREVVAAGGKVLLTDDPPVSGTALAETAHAICGLGVPDTAIVPLLALSDTEVPKPLARWSGVYLRRDEWSVHDRLTEGAVSETLAALLGPGHGVVASRQPWPARGYQRGRAGARFSVQVTRTDGPTRRSEIAVEGAGLGYLGRHAIAVASALPGYCPQVYGLADGLLYREWIPGALGAPDAAELALAVTDYVVARGRAMRVGADPTLRLRGPITGVGGGGQPSELLVRSARTGRPIGAARPDRPATLARRQPERARWPDACPILAGDSTGEPVTQGELPPRSVQQPGVHLLRRGLRPGRSGGRPAVG